MTAATLLRVRRIIAATLMTAASLLRKCRCPIPSLEFPIHECIRKTEFPIHGRIRKTLASTTDNNIVSFIAMENVKPGIERTHLTSMDVMLLRVRELMLLQDRKHDALFKRKLTLMDLGMLRGCVAIVGATNSTRKKAAITL
jgi:hypothetical protein